ncbi:MAG: SseB family protein [Paracoccaceae bacterium]
MTETALDLAHAAMESAPEDDVARLRFFERLGDSELFLLLSEEPEDDLISPETFDIGDQTVVLVFDREERLAQFVGQAAPYAALSGRIVVDLLAEQNLGLTLNPEVAPSSFLLAADGVAWLAETLKNEPEEVTGALSELKAPSVPDILIASLDAKLATATGLAQSAYLVGSRDKSGAAGHLLGFIGAQPGAEGALAKAVAEALTFSGIEAGALDVAFFEASDPVAAQMARQGLRFDLPQPVAADVPGHAPGMDPDRPPVLK